MKSLRNLKKKKRKYSKEGFVVPNEYPNFDTAVKDFQKSTLYIVKETRQREFMTRKPTHGSRKRKGNLMEQRKALYKKESDDTNN